jgi:hypothetical protein
LFLVPIMWLIACAVIIVSHARRPVSSDSTERGQVQDCPPDSAVDTSSGTPEPEASPHFRRNLAQLPLRRALGSLPGLHR